MPTIDAEMTEWLTPAEAGKILGLSARQVQRMLHYGRLPGMRLSTGPSLSYALWRVKRADVEAYIAAARTPREDAQP